jgi:hypothetical protein
MSFMSLVIFQLCVGEEISSLFGLVVRRCLLEPDWSFSCDKGSKNSSSIGDAWGGDDSSPSGLEPR